MLVKRLTESYGKLTVRLIEATHSPDCVEYVFVINPSPSPTTRPSHRSEVSLFSSPFTNATSLPAVSYSDCATDAGWRTAVFLLAASYSYVLVAPIASVSATNRPAASYRILQYRPMDHPLHHSVQNV